MTRWMGALGLMIAFTCGVEAGEESFGFLPGRLQLNSIFAGSDSAEFFGVNFGVIWTDVWIPKVRIIFVYPRGLLSLRISFYIPVSQRCGLLLEKHLEP